MDQIWSAVLTNDRPGPPALVIACISVPFTLLALLLGLTLDGHVPWSDSAHAFAIAFSPVIVPAGLVLFVIGLWCRDKWPAFRGDCDRCLGRCLSPFL